MGYIFFFVRYRGRTPEVIVEDIGPRLGDSHNAIMSINFYKNIFVYAAAIPLGFMIISRASPKIANYPSILPAARIVGSVNLTAFSTIQAFFMIEFAGYKCNSICFFCVCVFFS